jgi:hypothetical protein
MEENLSSQFVSWLVAAAAGGIVESFSGDKFFGNLKQLNENLKQYKPDQNHEINEAVVCSYLQATVQIATVYSENRGFPVNTYYVDLIPRVIGKVKVGLHKLTSNNPLPDNAEELFRDEHRNSSSFNEKVRNLLLGRNVEPLQLNTNQQSEKDWLDRVINEYGEFLIQFSQNKFKVDIDVLNNVLDEKVLLMQSKNAQDRQDNLHKNLLEQIEDELNTKFGKMSDNFKRFFTENWFNYFCGCFQYQLSRNTELARKYQAKVLAKIEGDTDKFLKHLAELSGEFGTRFAGIEQSLDWLGKDVSEVKDLLLSVLPLFAAVGDELTRGKIVLEINSNIVQELSKIIAADGDKTRSMIAALQEQNERLWEKINSLQANKRELPKTIPFID